jgi:DNA-binding transcriptional regulator YdaS (Cro superfamily)
MENSMDQHPQVARAVKICGSQPLLAAKMGCRQQTVSKMLNFEIPVSAEYALLMEAATAGEVPASETRPDLPWPSPSTQPADTAEPHPEPVSS